MLDHRLSKNVYLEKICSPIRYIIMSQTNLTLLVYMAIFTYHLFYHTSFSFGVSLTSTGTTTLLPFDTAPPGPRLTAGNT